MSRLPTGTVTFLLTDVEGSTRKWEAHPEAMRSAIRRHHEIVHAAIDRASGSRPQDQGEGDSVVAAFARATDAVACAINIQRAIHNEQWHQETPIRVRIGIHTGEIELRDERNYYGPAINRCARLRAIAHGGQTLLSLATQRLIGHSMPDGAHLRDLGLHHLRDLSEPERVFQLCHPDLPVDFPPVRSMEVLPNNLPVQVTSFVGRDRELAEIARLISAARLVTLTGPAGSGKTRLAVQVAAEVADEFSEGVWFIELATLSKPELLAQRVASAVGIREEAGRSLIDTLSDHFLQRVAVLIFDNCEHLIEGAATLADTLLRKCESLHILATSREPLRVPGELVWTTPPLSVFSGQEVTSVDMMRSEAVRLFVERASLASPSFTPTRNEENSMVEICRRLDGIPLAIELAASRINILTPHEIASKLDDRFRLLTSGARTAPARQQTLRAAIDWSYELLSSPEKIVLRRLAVFAGRFTLEAAEEVCSDDEVAREDVLALLGQLVSKSFIGLVKQGEMTRYQMNETTKQYASERLVAAREDELFRTRHQKWCLELVEKAEPHLFGPEQLRWFELLEADHDNLRAALEWSLEGGDTEAGLRLVGVVGPFWWRRGYYSEGFAWTRKLLAASPKSSPALRLPALRRAAHLASAAGRLDEATIAAEEGLELAWAANDDEAIAESLLALGIIAIYRGDPARGRSYSAEALKIGRQIGNRHTVARLLNNMGALAISEGDFPQARSLLEEALPLARGVGDLGLVGMVTAGLGELSLGEGNLSEARSLLEQSLAIARALGYKRLMSAALFVLGKVALADGDSEHAQSLFDEGAKISRESG